MSILSFISMKRLVSLTFAILCLLYCLPAQAHTREEAREEWRDKNPKLFSMNFTWSWNPSRISTEFTYDINRILNSNSEKGYFNIYKDYRGPIMSTGNLGAEFNWNCNRWFNTSGYLGVCPLWTTIYDGLTPEAVKSYTGVAVRILPKAKVMWCNTPIVRVYSCVALGLTYCVGFPCGGRILGDAQLGIAGVEVGNKCYGSAEFGIGSLYNGIQIGFGFKF